MKRIKVFILGIVGILLLNGCSSDKDAISNNKQYMEKFEKAYLLPEEFGTDGKTVTEALASLCGDEKYTFKEREDGIVDVTYQAMTVFLDKDTEVMLTMLYDVKSNSVDPVESIQLYFNDSPMDPIVRDAFLYACEGYSTLAEELLEQWSDGETESYIVEMQKFADECREDGQRYDERIKEELQESLTDGTIVSKNSSCFPIMFRGYEGSECPVMVQDEQNGELVSGTYEEMLASCVDDGITMYAPPTFYNGFICTATKWDAYPDQWYDGLLTYSEFIAEVDRLAGVGEVVESSDPYSDMFVDEVEIPYEEIAGSYSGIKTEGCSISMYSSIEDETVGNIQFEYNGNNLSGELVNLQTNVYQILTSDGTEVIFGVFTDNGNINLDLYINGIQTDYLFLYEHYYS